MQENSFKIHTNTMNMRASAEEIFALIFLLQRTEEELLLLASLGAP
jgi:hypothetical protein